MSSKKSERRRGRPEAAPGMCKTSQVAVRLTAAEAEALRDHSRATGRPVAAIVRDALGKAGVFGPQR